MTFATADLYDAHMGALQVAMPLFKSYGNRTKFSGRMITLKVFEDNKLVRSMLEKDGDGQVLVIDGGGSLNCALVGDRLADLALKNTWAGIVVYGCIRDSADISELDIGIKALNTNPKKSIKKGLGEENIPLTFAGITFTPGESLYADADGIITSKTALL